MFDVGFAEIFLLALIGLLVLGPERLPGVARTVGGFVRKARASWISLRNTIESELAEADISAPIKQASAELKQIGKNLTNLTDPPESKSFAAEKRESATVEPQAETQPAEAHATEPKQAPDSEKSEDV